MGRKYVAMGKGGKGDFDRVGFLLLGFFFTIVIKERDRMAKKDEHGHTEAPSRVSVPT